MGSVRANFRNFLCLLFLMTGVSFAGLNPSSTLYVNLGPLVIDDYTVQNTSGIYPNCPTAADWTVRRCFTDVILPSYKQQGVKGVRFLFGIRGAIASTALNADGTVNQTWLSNLNLFFQDLVNTQQILHVIPTPAIGAGWSDAEQIVSATDACTGASISLKWWPYTVFPFDPTTNFPYVQASNPNQTYNCAPANPIFFGWPKIYDLVRAVVGAAQSHGLTVDIFELMQEVNVTAFTVQARLIYDPLANGGAGEDVLLNLQGIMGSRATFSSVADESNMGPNGQYSAPMDCSSVYGESARVIGLSEIQAAIFGGLIGVPNGSGSDFGLRCGGSNPLMMLQMPQGHTLLPDVVDVHTYACLKQFGSGICAPNPQVSSAATLDFNAITAYWASHSLPRQLAIIGETWWGPSNNGTCSPPQPADAANSMVTGFNASQLPNPSVTTIFQPQGNLVTPCLAVPQQVNPPYTPSQ